MSTLFFEKHVESPSPGDLAFLTLVSNRYAWQGFAAQSARIQIMGHQQRPDGSFSVFLSVGPLLHPHVDLIDFHWLDLGQHIHCPDPKVMMSYILAGPYLGAPPLPDPPQRETWRDRPPML